MISHTRLLQTYVSDYITDYATATASTSTVSVTNLVNVNYPWPALCVIQESHELE